MDIIIFLFTFLLLPLTSPLIVGIVTFRLIDRNENIKFIAAFNLLFVISYIVYFFQMLSWPVIDTLNPNGKPYLFVSIRAIVPVVFAMLFFSYVYKQSFKNWWAWLFLAYDLLYWLNIVLVHGDFVLNLLRWISLAIIALLPSVFAVISWSFVKRLSLENNKVGNIK
ncbi:MAG: hypothetical protein JNK81_10580 [Anaerolineales bacterium]|nr:hypothetical protein [Anaerolineales bacterium]